MSLADHRDLRTDVYHGGRVRGRSCGRGRLADDDRVVHRKQGNRQVDLLARAHLLLQEWFSSRHSGKHSPSTILSLALRSAGGAAPTRSETRRLPIQSTSHSAHPPVLTPLIMFPQAIADVAHSQLQLYAVSHDERPSVHVAATLLEGLCYSNK